MFWFTRWVVPALLLCVSFMDTGNYVSAMSAGSIFRYQQLVPLVMSHIVAGGLQYLAVVLGVRTRRNLCETCQQLLPYWMCCGVNMAGVLGLILTDMSLVIGTAVALGVLFGCNTIVSLLLSLIDVSVLLKMRHTSVSCRQFVEIVVALSSLLIFFVIFYDLASIRSSLNIEEILIGAMPTGGGFLVSLSLLGSTAMPQSIFITSELAKERAVKEVSAGDVLSEKTTYELIRKISIRLILVCISGALAVNVALVLLAANISSSGSRDFSGLQDVYDLLSGLSHSAGTCFLVMLLLTGQTSGFVIDLVSNILHNGFFEQKRCLIPFSLPIRPVSVTICVAFTLFKDENILTVLINFTQIALSLILVIVSVPLFMGFWILHNKQLS